ncbi:hypothetical protein BgAZ_400740 [Babesia gibsoni]|uniref:Uncharacterized protein n=1 Tax=Babesia gibsoni TaxID=33632 RepID=A0AAD8LJL9_BABGI|nr:hypothetical protein BgAZ_400740 [Babesia gibsoni]
MSAFISPPADDPITKLQNLLQNTLFSFADITVTYAPEQFKELEEECIKHGIQLTETKDDMAIDQLQSDANEGDEPQKIPESLVDRVERLGQLNDHIQATVDDLPDTGVSKEEVLSQVKLLNEECNRASEELISLYKEFDMAFQMLRNHMNKCNRTN